MNDAASIVEFRSVWKRFGQVTALADVSCRFTAGQITALVGDNGAGKSTLIKTICGVFAPDEGQFTFEDRPARWNSPDDARRAGVEPTWSSPRPPRRGHT